MVVVMVTYSGLSKVFIHLGTAILLLYYYITILIYYFIAILLYCYKYIAILLYEGVKHAYGFVFVMVTSSVHSPTGCAAGRLPTRLKSVLCITSRTWWSSDRGKTPGVWPQTWPRGVRPRGVRPKTWPRHGRSGCA